MSVFRKRNVVLILIVTILMVWFYVGLPVYKQVWIFNRVQLLLRLPNYYSQDALFSIPDNWIHTESLSKYSPIYYITQVATYQATKTA